LTALRISKGLAASEQKKEENLADASLEKRRFPHLSLGGEKEELLFLTSPIEEVVFRI